MEQVWQWREGPGRVGRPETPSPEPTVPWLGLHCPSPSTGSLALACKFSLGWVERGLMRTEMRPVSQTPGPRG